MLVCPKVMLSPFVFFTRRLSAEMVHPKTIKRCLSWTQMGDTGVLVDFAYPKSLAVDVVCLKKTEYHGIARNVRIAMLKMLSKP